MHVLQLKCNNTSSMVTFIASYIYTTLLTTKYFLLPKDIVDIKMYVIKYIDIQGVITVKRY